MRGIAAVCCAVLSAPPSVSAQETLRKYADPKGFNIGVAVNESNFSSIQQHNDLIKREFNTIVCENSMKAQNVAPSKTSYDFSVPDRIVSFAQQNNMKVRGHTLVWYNQNPSWLAGGDRKTLLANMKYHIEKVMGHYRGKCYQWDVVNEAFSSEGGYRDCAWYTIIGEDYIDSAFVYAHAADPDAKLYLNDYNNSYVNDQSTAIYNKVKRMLDNGIPLHGVGFQCHERTSKMTPDLYSRIKTNFNRFAALGLEIAVTEIDIRTETGSNAQVQAEVYGTFLKAGLAMPKFNTFLIWGVRDQDSWTGADQNALIFDNSWQPKPAYDTLLALLKTPPTTLERSSAPKSGRRSLVQQANGSVDIFDLRGVKKASIGASLRAEQASLTASGIAIIRPVSSRHAVPLADVH